MVGIDNRDSSLDLIKSLYCCELIVDAGEGSTQDVPKNCNNGLGYGAVLIIPESQKAFDYAAPLARKSGIVCIAESVRMKLFSEMFSIEVCDYAFEYV